MPITEMTERYKCEDGGLYGEVRNEPPERTVRRISKSRRKSCRDVNGRPADNGKIGLISIGFSNPSIEWEAFDLRRRRRSSEITASRHRQRLYRRTLRRDVGLLT